MQEENRKAQEANDRRRAQEEAERQRKALEEEAAKRKAARSAAELAAALSVGAQFSHAQLAAATGSWSTKLGEGAFGVVYKAEVLHGVTGAVAIKQLKPGAVARSDLEAEVAVAKALSRCDYLLPLLGTVRAAAAPQKT